MTDRIEEIRIALNNELSASHKKFITLRAANKLLWDKRLISEFERDKGFLKSLLEQKKLNAVQTESQPRQWRIYPTNLLVGEDEIKANKPEVPSSSSRRAEIEKYNTKRTTIIDPYTILGLLGIAAVIFFGLRSHNNIERQNAHYNNNSPESESTEAAVPTQQEEISSPSPSTAVPSTSNSSTQKLPKEISSRNVFTFKSTYYDKERNGIILQTNEEVTFHTFNYDNNTVTQKSRLNGEWIEIVYPFSETYVEEGPLSNTYVLKVETLGLREIWYSPEVPNLGYDYDDGTRLSCYGLQQISGEN